MAQLGNPTTTACGNGETIMDMNDDFDKILEESMKRKNEYNDWRNRFAAQCLKEGRHFPDSYELQREWNREQKRMKEVRRLQKMKDAFLERKRKMEKKVAEMNEILGIGQNSGEQQFSASPAVEEELPDFDAIDADLLRMQEQRELAEKKAQREQEALMSVDPFMEITAEHLKLLPEPELSVSEYDKETDI